MSEDTRPERVRTDRHLIRITTGDTTEDILFDPGKTLLSETLAVEDRFNLTWPQLIVGIGTGRTRAIAAIIWLMRKRSQPKLQPADIELNMADLDVLDPDYLPEYGGLPGGEAYGDDLADAVEDIFMQAPKDSPAPAEQPGTPTED